jgi:hypothetical protein
VNSMRLVLDFLAGILTGLRNDDTSYPIPKGKARRINNTGAKSSKLVRTLVQFCGLMLIGVCGALAVFASAEATKKTPTTRAYFKQAEAPAIMNDEVLSTDSDAAPRTWRYIVIHHSASMRGSAQSFDDSHRRERGWKSLGYHFVIGNGIDQGDGLVVAGPRWYGQEAGAHANAVEYNEHGIGICLVGNFDEQPPTPAQWSMVRKLVARLATKYGIPSYNIFGHNQIRRGGTTACPGKLFPLNELRNGL